MNIINFKSLIEECDDSINSRLRHREEYILVPSIEGLSIPFEYHNPNVGNSNLIILIMNSMEFNDMILKDNE